jgi:hypothetical protein
MNEEKAKYALAALTVIFLAILQVCWFLVKTIVSCVFYFVVFFAFGWLIGGAVSHTPHEHC